MNRHASIILIPETVNLEGIEILEEKPYMSVSWAFDLYCSLWREAATASNECRYRISNASHYGLQTDSYGGRSYIRRASNHVVNTLTRLDDNFNNKGISAQSGSSYWGEDGCVNLAYKGLAEVKDCGAAISRDRAIGGERSVAISSLESVVGDFGVAIATDPQHGVVSAGKGGMIQIYHKDDQWVVGIIDGEQFEPDVKYCLGEGELVPIDKKNEILMVNAVKRVQRYNQLMRSVSMLGSTFRSGEDGVLSALQENGTVFGSEENIKQNFIQAFFEIDLENQ